jgi:protoporphyrinogen oxidase
VENILVEKDRVTAIRVAGTELSASAVLSTAPINILGKIVQGTTSLDYLTRFRYRPMVFVNMRFSGRGLLPDVVTWTPEKKFPFFRLTETPLSMPWLAPTGKTLVTVDIGCEVGDEPWTMNDEALGEYCLRSLDPVIKGARDKYLGCRVQRTPFAYPVFLAEYEELRREFARATNIEGLHSIGRNGEFAHIFMEDVYWRTLSKVRRVANQRLAA